MIWQVVYVLGMVLPVVAWGQVPSAGFRPGFPCVNLTNESVRAQCLASQRDGAVLTGSLPQTSKPSITNISVCAPSIDDYRTAVGGTEIWGGTRIRFSVASTGNLYNAEVVRPSGNTRAHRLLDRTALVKLSECKFKSGVDGNRSIDGTFYVEIYWRRNQAPEIHQEDFQLPSGYVTQAVRLPQEYAAATTFSKCLPDRVKNNCWDKHTLATGEQYVGVFQNGESSGEGILYGADGKMKSSGLWDPYRQLVNSYPIDPNRFPFEPAASVSSSTTASVMQQHSQATHGLAVAPSAVNDLGKVERDRLSAEIDVERRKRQDLEQRLATEARERERLVAEARERERLPTPPFAPPVIRRAHALVIGNAAYPGSGRLDNPVNDANAISQKLRAMGFTVTTVTDANRQRLVQAMSQFRRTAASAEVSLLFYSGHGVQVFGKNYMLPTDVDQTDVAQATIQGVSLNEVVENFLPGKTKLVFLDACRDNPLQRTGDRSVSRGLAPIAVAEGTLIAYATKDGQVASDGTGQRNSPFTQALLEHLSDPSDIAVVLRKVREKVMRATGGKQQPWEYGSLTGGELVLSAIRR